MRENIQFSLLLVDRGEKRISMGNIDSLHCGRMDNGNNNEQTCRHYYVSNMPGHQHMHLPDAEPYIPLNEPEHGQVQIFAIGYNLMSIGSDGNATLHYT